MAIPAERTDFISSLYQLHQACNSKANDGALTTDQRSVFITAVIYVNSDIGKAWNRDFIPIPSNIVHSAITEIIQAVTAINAACDDQSVLCATKELWDANTAIDQVLGV